jgi:hypothetical protein
MSISTLTACEVLDGVLLEEKWTQRHIEIGYGSGPYKSKYFNNY